MMTHAFRAPRWFAFGLLVGVELSACRRTPSPEASAGSQTAGAGARTEERGDRSSAAASRSTPSPSTPGSADTLGSNLAPLGAEPRAEYAKRIVAIGDLHGDLSAARAALQLAGATDAGGSWVGGAMAVVQTGDQIDRGDTDRAVLDLFEALAEQAEAAGGEVHAMNGNHEAMNVMLDFRYVTPRAFAEFADLEGSSPHSAKIEDRVEELARGRAEAFFPGGRYATLIAKRPVMLVLGDTAFAHGGIGPEHGAALQDINEAVSAWMRGQGPLPEAVTDDAGPLWMRAYSAGTPNDASCELLRRTLSLLGARRMVVGHTVQKDGITSACNERVWRIDVGLSSHYGGKKLEVLEIAEGKVKVLSAEKGP